MQVRTALRLDFLRKGGAERLGGSQLGMDMGSLPQESLGTEWELCSPGQ